MAKQPLKKQGLEQQLEPKALQALSKEYSVVGALVDLKLPLTRESYLKLAYGNPNPPELEEDPELEDLLPPIFQRGADVQEMVQELNEASSETSTTSDSTPQP